MVWTVQSSVHQKLGWWEIPPKSHLRAFSVSQMLFSALLGFTRLYSDLLGSPRRRQRPQSMHPWNSPRPPTDAQCAPGGSPRSARAPKMDSQLITGTAKVEFVRIVCFPKEKLRIRGCGRAKIGRKRVPASPLLPPRLLHVLRLESSGVRLALRSSIIKLGSSEYFRVNHSLEYPGVFQGLILALFRGCFQGLQAPVSCAMRALG